MSLCRSIRSACAARAALAVLLCAPFPSAAETSPAASAASVDPAAVRSRDDSASEYWDLSAVFTTGERLFARYSISNEGPGNNTAYVIGQVVLRDGKVVPFTNGRREGRWTLSDDGLRMQVGSSLLDLHGPERRVEVDKSRKGIHIFLGFATEPTHAVRWPAAPERYRLDLLERSVPVAGTIFIPKEMEKPLEVEGQLTLTHVWMDRTESKIATRVLELHGAGGQGAPYLTTLLSPKGNESGWLVMTGRDGARVEVTDLQVELEGKGSGSSKGYRMPAQIRVQGVLPSGERVSGEITTGKHLLASDPLKVTPQPFRWFLSFMMKPRRVWLEATYSLTIESASGSEGTGHGATLSGTGVVSVYYLNPL